MPTLQTGRYRPARQTAILSDGPAYSRALRRNWDVSRLNKITAIIGGLNELAEIVSVEKTLDGRF